MAKAEVEALRDLMVEFKDEGGKTVRMKWTEFLTSKEVPTQYRNILLDARSKILGERRGIHGTTN